MTEASDKKRSENSEKRVPLSDFITVQKKLQKAEVEAKQLRQDVSSLKSDLAVSKASMDDDDDVKAVRAMLVGEAQQIKEDRSKLESERTSLDEREREVTAKSLVAEYSAKGLDLELSTIQTAEDPTHYAREQWIEHLEGLAETLKKGEAESENKSENAEAGQQQDSPVYESGGQGRLKVMPKDMTDAQFAEYTKGLEMQAQAPA